MSYEQFSSEKVHNNASDPLSANDPARGHQVAHVCHSPHHFQRMKSAPGPGQLTCLTHAGEECVVYVKARAEQLERSPEGEGGGGGGRRFWLDGREGCRGEAVRAAAAAAATREEQRKTEDCEQGGYGELEGRRRQTRRRVGLRLVLGSRSAFVHSDDAKSNWTGKGQVGWWERVGEHREGEAGEGSVRGVTGCKGCKSSPGRWKKGC